MRKGMAVLIVLILAGAATALAQGPRTEGSRRRGLWGRRPAMQMGRADERPEGVDEQIRVLRRRLEGLEAMRAQRGRAKPKARGHEGWPARRRRSLGRGRSDRHRMLGERVKAWAEGLRSRRSGRGRSGWIKGRGRYGSGWGRTTRRWGCGWSRRSPMMGRRHSGQSRRGAMWGAGRFRRGRPGLTVGRRRSEAAPSERRWDPRSRRRGMDALRRSQERPGLDERARSLERKAQALESLEQRLNALEKRLDARARELESRSRSRSRSRR